MSAPVVVKLGGAALRDPAVLAPVAEGLARLWALEKNVVVVHGGGPAINAALEAAGLTWEFVDGLRVTSAAMMDVVQNALMGVNRSVVDKLENQGLPACGLDSLSAGLLVCRPMDKRLGQVGVPARINLAVLKTLRTGGFLPVITPVGVFENGSPCNVNADAAAAEIAVALGARRLVFLTDTRGIRGAGGSPLSRVDHRQLSGLAQDGTLTGGMLAKARAVQRALDAGVSEVVIAHGEDAAGLAAPFMPGTLCTPHAFR